MYWWISCFTTPIVEKIDRITYDAVGTPSGHSDNDIVETITINNAEEILERAWLEVVEKTKELFD